jgi:hypothetical protein
MFCQEGTIIFVALTIFVFETNSIFSWCLLRDWRNAFRSVHKFVPQKLSENHIFLKKIRKGQKFSDLFLFLRKTIYLNKNFQRQNTFPKFNK